MTLSLKCTGRKRFGFNLIGLFQIVMTTWFRNKIIIITMGGKNELMRIKLMSSSSQNKQFLHTLLGSKQCVRTGSL